MTMKYFVVNNGFGLIRKTTINIDEVNDVLYSWEIDSWVGCAKKLGYLKSLKRINPDIEYYESRYIW